MNACKVWFVMKLSWKALHFNHAVNYTIPLKLLSRKLMRYLVCDTFCCYFLTMCVSFKVVFINSYQCNSVK